jgi:hypothetical protein
MAEQTRTSTRLRLTIAQTAARYVAVDGINDFIAAKRKAIQQLGIKPGKNMPSNFEVEQALMAYQQLFQSQEQSQNLLHLRNCAYQAMRFMEPFKPLLVGPVLTGTATIHTEITLHIFSDEPEQPGFFLDDKGIPYQIMEKTVRINNRDTIDLTACRFVAGNNPLLLVVFAGKQKSLVPLSTIDGKPMQRANIKQVAALVAQSTVR